MTFQCIKKLDRINILFKALSLSLCVYIYIYICYCDGGGGLQ